MPPTKTTKPGATTPFGAKVLYSPKEAKAEIRSAFRENGYSSALTAAAFQVNRVTFWRWLTKLGLVEEIARLQEAATKKGTRVDGRRERAKAG